jgi:leader peptidase (prepilin peptidase)/N-methyltransferase
VAAQHVPAAFGGGVNASAALLAFASLAGLVFGSFATMLTWRLPQGTVLTGARSACPACGSVLGVRDLVPVLSWLLNRGHCRACGTGIPLRYPLTELAMAALFAATAWRFGPTMAAVPVLVLAFTLLCMTVIDFEHGYLPDMLQAVAAIAGIAHTVLHARYEAAGLGALLGLVIGVALRYGFHLLRGRHGLGLGDVKLFAVAGLWLGPLALLWFFIIGGALGALFGTLWRWRGGSAEFPFGPALCLSLFGLVLWG